MRRDQLALLMAAYGVAYFLLMRLPGDIVRSPIAGSDLSSYYTAGYLVRTGQAVDLYAVAPDDTILGDATGGPYRRAGDELGIARQHYYIYPPFFALLAAPMSLVSFPAARAGWLLMDLALLASFVWIYAAWRRADGAGPTFMEWVLIATTLGLEFLPLIWALAIGQTSLWLLVLLSGTMLLAKRGRDGAAGVLLGVATAIKLTPALLVIYFALRGRARLALHAAAWFALANVAAVAALGLDATLEFYLDVVPMMSGGTAYFLNQSLAGTFSRLVGAGDVRQVALESSAAVRLLAGLSALALLGVTAWAFRHVARRRGEDRPIGLALDLEFSAVALLTLVVSPISWSHHYLIAVIPLYSVVAAAARRGRFSTALAGAVGLAYLLIARKPHFELFLAGPWRLALSAAMLGALILWAACLIVLSWGAAPPSRETGVARAA